MTVEDEEGGGGAAAAAAGNCVVGPDMAENDSELLWPPAGSVVFDYLTAPVIGYPLIVLSALPNDD